MLAEWWSYFYSLLPNTSDFGKMPEEAAPISIALCGVGTLYLCRYTGGLGYLSVPLNYFALFFGMLVSNWLFHGVDLHIDKLVVQPVLIHLLGMTLAALAVMYFFTRDAMRDG
jgi:hypothetical protein